MGILWEHCVLNEIQGRLQHRALRYWRNKRGAELDFVLRRHGGEPIAVEYPRLEPARALPPPTA